MSKYDGKEKRKLSRYRVTEKANLILGEGQGVHTIHAELRSIGLGGALVRILGAFARNEHIVEESTFLLTITGDGPLNGITTSVTVVKTNPGAYGSKCVNLSFDGELKGENYETFMRWRRRQTAIGRMMPPSLVPPH